MENAVIVVPFPILLRSDQTRIGQRIDKEQIIYVFFIRLGTSLRCALEWNAHYFEKHQ